MVLKKSMDTEVKIFNIRKHTFCNAVKPKHLCRFQIEIISKIFRLKKTFILSDFIKVFHFYFTFAYYVKNSQYT